MEIQIIENLHRKDLTPLEEAAGFRALIKTNPDKHSAASIASRIGKSPSWVWDVMKLLDLIPAAKQLLDEGRMTVNHAIPIARLKPDQQKKVIHPTAGGLFVDETRLHFDQSTDTGDYADMKPVTVRELNTWINDHIRFDAKHAAKAAPLEFEPVAEKLEEAAAKPGRGNKVIAITRDHYVQESARDSSERTFGPRSWKRADGTKGTTEGAYGKPWKDSPTCEHSVMGYVAVGPGQGEAFEVCIAREKCQVHWGSEMKAREKARKQRESGTKNKTGGKSSWQIEQERRQAEQERRDKRWKVFGPALKKATFEKLEKVPNDLPKSVYQHLLQKLKVPANTKKADLPKALLVREFSNHFSQIYSWYENDMVKLARVLGVDVKACEPKNESLQTSGVKKTTKKAKKR